MIKSSIQLRPRGYTLILVEFATVTQTGQIVFFHECVIIFYKTPENESPQRDTWSIQDAKHFFKCVGFNAGHLSVNKLKVKLQSGSEICFVTITLGHSNYTRFIKITARWFEVSLGEWRIIISMRSWEKHCMVQWRRLSSAVVYGAVNFKIMIVIMIFL